TSSSSYISVLGFGGGTVRSPAALPGAPSVCEPLVTGDVPPCCSARTAASAAWKPILECVPSQNGLFTDAPQRHSENAGLPVRSYSFPSASTSVTGPSTRYGPFFLTVIFTSAIHASTEPICHSGSPQFEIGRAHV